jgi:hypothetical protein
MNQTFSYLTGTNEDMPERATAPDVSHEEEDIVRDNPGGSSTANTLNCDENEQVDNDDDAREYLFPQLEQDLAPKAVSEFA